MISFPYTVWSLYQISLKISWYNLALVFYNLILFIFFFFSDAFCLFFNLFVTFFFSFIYLQAVTIIQSSVLASLVFFLSRIGNFKLCFSIRSTQEAATENSGNSCNCGQVVPPHHFKQNSLAFTCCFGPALFLLESYQLYSSVYWKLHQSHKAWD